MCLFTDVRSLLSGLARRTFASLIFDVALGGVEMLPCVMQAAGRTPVVVVSDGVNSAEFTHAILHGASAYLPTTDPLAIVNAATALRNGITLFDTMTLRETVAPTFTTQQCNLTPAEERILHLISQGLSNAQMVEYLGISLNTVKTHVRHVLSKLGVKDRTQAAIWALQQPQYHPVE